MLQTIMWCLPGVLVVGWWIYLRFLKLDMYGLPGPTGLPYVGVLFQLDRKDATVAMFKVLILEPRVPLPFLLLQRTQTHIHRW